ncbi:hypothetical protein H4CHR_01591 [Variovorax sp. PBS-H4]|uniref:hypothetical protein n=1 Tax=Variovorax sp. PBS-H4 TaxID=434008 RepID=UPI001317A54D|nr:hypothetical protein [Variovorax sp. PBS-H4]VTU25424.1 hypothetical protein H4CHR_01591 [Variovorax sp. PBS-H4]
MDLPELPAPFGYVRDSGGHVGPLVFQHAPFDERTRLLCSTEQVYRYAQLRAYAEEAVKQERERIAEAWKGCICEGSGEDIGQAILEDAAIQTRKGHG